MANRQSTNRFGIDAGLLKTFDWKLAIDRILVDIRSDFIYAPHLSVVFHRAAGDLQDEVHSELNSGRYAPASPITIDVPKSARMAVVPQGSRGPTFSRPGSILLSKDRLVYQLLADQAAPLVEKNTDRKRSFSHRHVTNSPEMFAPSRESWDRMQKRLNLLSSGGNGYVIKADIANCFQSVNQHTLINHLESIQYPATFRNALDAMLVLNTGDRNSRGLIQGVFPSDLLGNFYLNPIDEMFADMDVPSVRYVDDMYAFVSSLAKAEETMRELTRKLRDYDLSLNEAKSKLLSFKSLILEEPDLEKLFGDAMAEVKDEAFDTDYGFQSEWNEEGEADHEDIELDATIRLFDSIAGFPAHVEKIERFCLPLLAAAGSSHAIDHVLTNFSRRPAMAQIYCSYLASFLVEKQVLTRFEALLTDPELYYDWQHMWILAALIRQAEGTADVVATALRIYRDGQRHEALRAVAAVFVAKHGSFTRQKELSDHYAATGSIYLQTAVLYGTRYFQKAARRAAVKSWSGHSTTHGLVAKAIEGMS